MAKHLDVQKNRALMVQSLRDAISTQSLKPGDKLPTLRDLMATYAVSMSVTWDALQTLIDEGLIHSVPRKGIFVGKAQSDSDIYLLCYDVDPHKQAGQGAFVLGFEERIAALGGASISLRQSEAKAFFQNGQLPPLAGLARAFCYGARDPWWGAEIPCVEIARSDASLSPTDTVCFNDFEGGRKAARHLWNLGHRRIAFLGLHSTSQMPRTFNWSVQRELGWAAYLREQNADPTGFSLLDVPSEVCDFHMDLTHEQARFVAQRLTKQVLLPSLRSDSAPTALVIVNQLAARAVIKTLAAAGLESSLWPAILAFDDHPVSSGGVVSYLRLPWDELGRNAAQILWERRNGRLTGPPQNRMVDMPLIPRLTCRPTPVRSISAVSLHHAA